MSDFDDFMSETDDRPQMSVGRQGITFTRHNPCPLAWQLSKLIPCPPHFSDDKVVQGVCTVAQLRDACTQALNMLSEEAKYMQTRLAEYEMMVKADPKMVVRTIWVVNE